MNIVKHTKNKKLAYTLGSLLQGDLFVFQATLDVKENVNIYMKCNNKTIVNLNTGQADLDIDLSILVYPITDYEFTFTV